MYRQPGDPSQLPHTHKRNAKGVKYESLNRTIPPRQNPGLSVRADDPCWGWRQCGRRRMSGGGGRDCRWWPKPAKATTCRREPAARERAGRAPDLSPWRPNTNLNGAQYRAPARERSIPGRNQEEPRIGKPRKGWGKSPRNEERESVCVCGSASPKAPTRQIPAQGGQGPPGHRHPTSRRPPLRTTPSRHRPRHHRPHHRRCTEARTAGTTSGRVSTRASAATRRRRRRSPPPPIACPRVR